MDLEQTLKGTKAACLIFMHAGIEACLVDLAKLVGGIDPGAFRPLLKGKQIPLDVALQSSADVLLQEQIERFLETMDRQSLVERTRTMFRILQEPTISGTIFDESRVRRIEEARNGCAHGRVDITDFSTIYDDLAYLREVGDFFVNAIATKYGLPNPKFSLEELRKAEEGVPAEG